MFRNEKILLIADQYRLSEVNQEMCEDELFKNKSIVDKDSLKN